MAASRFRERAGVYLYGKLRRTDFLPVGEDQEDEVFERGYESVSSSDDEEYGLQRAYDAREEDREEDDSEASEGLFDAEVSRGVSMQCLFYSVYLFSLECPEYIRS